MNEFDELLKKRAREEPFPLPEDYAGRVFAACASLEEKQVKAKKTHTLHRWAMGVAAALAVFVAVPNLSAPAAAAMERIPVLGSIVKVITFRTYTYDDEHAHADVSVPQIEGSGSAAASVNADAQKYTDALVEQFKADCADLGEAYEGLNVTYDVVTDSDTWFTLRVDALETKASGYQFAKIYNIDKTTDQVVALDGLFKDDSDWAKALSDEVLRQMNEQMADASSGTAYFTEDFTGVTADQNYYFDAEGNLVLAFDEYTVAPGSMGAVEFTIAPSAYENLLK
ncbi:MAG: RsiV family protein [Oscillibacter sp.]|jgi:hypothetical protein|nr:RsiV family protein [Oscillibacter sp.]